MTRASMELIVAALLVGVIAVPGFAQRTTTTVDQDEQQSVPTQQPRSVQGRNAETGAGQVGRSQNRDDTARVAGFTPLGRMNTRIENRVQNRLRNRIDRNYGPEASTNDPFAVAEERTRTPGRRKRR